MRSVEPVPYDGGEVPHRAWAGDDPTTWHHGRAHPDAVYHVAGRHPLAGDNVGRDAVLGYMLEVATITGGRGGW